MATFQNFEEIKAWQSARVLTKELYRISGQGAFARDFGLRDQIRRASTSIGANIAEGFERAGTGEFLQFLAVAKGSAGEVRAHLYIAFDSGYLSQQALDELLALVIETSRMIGGLMSYLRRTPMKGSKRRLNASTTRNSELGTRDSTGAILIGVLIILLTISLIGATLSSFFFSVTTVAEIELSRAQALYLAEAGVAKIVSQIRQAGALGGEAQVELPPTPLGAGTYQAALDVEAGLITATGVVRGVRRTIQVKYYPF